jgi:hypothetical protein
MRRRPDNFEGAFPLLLIGSVLVVYAGILASQQIGVHSSHLPIWGLLGGVGAVIVGAGIYSTFLEPETTTSPSSAREWVTVPRAEGESRSGAGRPRARLETAPESAPIWWEGPPTSANASPSRTPTATYSARTERRPVPTPAAPVQGRPGKPAQVVPRPTAHYSYQELTDELSELEALVYGGAVSSTRASSPSPGGGPTPMCMDCERPLNSAGAPTLCRSCGRGLCARCAASSKSEDGEVRCVECRVFEP